MMYVYASLLTILGAVWVFLVIIGLPGTWLMLLSVALVGWLMHDPTGPAMFAWWTYAALVVLALLGELLEFLLGAAGSKQAGGTRWGIAGAIVGGIVGGILGTPLLPVIGTLIGSCIGAGLGAIAGDLYAGKEVHQSLLSGKGAAVGRFWGTVAKVAVAAAMWLWMAVAAFF